MEIWMCASTSTELHELWDCLITCHGAGIREWGMCHILFKQPDAVCFGGWFTATPQPLIAAHVVERFLPPSAVNWLGKFPAGYHDDGWHPRFGKWRSSEETAPLTPTATATAAMATRAGETLPALSYPSMHFSVDCSHASITMYICSCRGIQVPRD